MFFLEKMQNIIDIEHELKDNVGNVDLLEYAKKYGFSDKVIAHRWGMTEDDIYNLRQENKITPVFKMVDTCAAEFVSETHTSTQVMNKRKNQSLAIRKKLLYWDLVLSNRTRCRVRLCYGSCSNGD